jgi:hypothetical protein
MSGERDIILTRLKDLIAEGIVKTTTEQSAPTLGGAGEADHPYFSDFPGRTEPVQVRKLLSTIETYLKPDIISDPYNKKV